MRKITLLLTCLFGISVFSQIKVLKTETLVEVGKDNSVGLYKKENKFTFNYQDLNTSNLNTIRSFSFENQNNDVDGLYSLILNGFATLPASNITLELPNDIIELHYEKNYGQPTVQFIQYINKNRKYVGKSQYLTRTQIDKIFGKSTGKSSLYQSSAVAAPQQQTKKPATTYKKPASKSSSRK